MKKFTIASILWAAFLICNLVVTVRSGEDESDADADDDDEVNGYIFTCSRSLKTGAHNQLQLRRYGSLPAGFIAVKVTYQNNYNTNETIAAEKRYKVEEGERESSFELFLEQPDEYVYTGKITMNGTLGEKDIGGSDKVYFTSSKDFLVFIQTDKPIYKTGQTVKFRVLRVDGNLKPSTDCRPDIWLEDASGTRLFQRKDVSMERGMRQFEFPLADEPIKGEWKISFSCKGEVTSTTFEVKEYVLPKFDVKIGKPPYVLADDEVIPIEVEAKYTYGQPVQGHLRMNISLEHFAWSTEKLPTKEIEGELVNGLFKYNINVSEIETEDYYRYRRIQIVASVIESGTDVERNETEYIQRQYSPYNINFNRDQGQFYKPGLPYNGKLTVTNPDGSPTKNEGIQLSYTVNRERIMSGWKASKTVKFAKNYTTDENGVIEFVIPRQNTDSTSITLEAKSLKYAKENRTPSNQRQNSLSQPQASKSLTPWFSPSGSFIQIQQVDKSLPCGTKANVKVLFTSKTDGDYKFEYQVIYQGKVVKNGIVEKSFKVDDDVACEYEDETKVIDDVEVQVDPPKDSSKPEDEESEEEECKAAKDARYVPPVGDVDIEIDTSPTWSPTIYVIVQYIRNDREVVADSQKFTLDKCFQNQVKFQFGDEVKQPGTRTSIRVTSSPNSLCGIKVVDKSVSLLNSNDQLTSEKIFAAKEALDNGMYYTINRCNEDEPQPGLYYSKSTILPPRPPQGYRNSKYEDSGSAFYSAGKLFISNLIINTRPCESKGGSGNIVFDSDSYAGYGGAVAMASTARRPAARPPAANEEVAIATKSVVDVRDFFPETWLFELEETGVDGVYMEKEKLPHTITEWIGSAVCINEEDGLGLSNTTSIKGFQAFFISMTIPYSAVRGELFWISISIFSYVDEALPITVSMDDLEGLEVTSESVNRDVCVEPGTSTVIKVQLKGTALGTQNITIRAESAQSSEVCGDSSVSDAVAKDAIVNSLIIEAEGWPAEKVESVLFCPEEEENEVFKKTIELNEPKDIVPDSTRAYFDVTGNVLGKSLENVDNLVAMPTGCGEQNMVKFAPNVVAMDVLIGTNQLTEKYKNKIIKNLNTGYQRQLRYRHSDGSFSAFGNVDNSGSMFLTGFCLASFSEAEKYILIDNKTTIVPMQEWIASKQQEDGCFPDVGKIIDRGLQGGIEKESSPVPITAYILAALAISDYQNQTVMKRAQNCISDSKDSSFYATFLAAYAESLTGNEESAKERIEDVKARFTSKGNAKYYHDMNATTAQDIETTGYAIMALLNIGEKPSDVLPFVQFLMLNMNAQGGFYSTQDTCVAMKALGQFAKLTFKDPVDISMTLSGGLNEEIEIKEDEKLLVKKYKVEDVPSEVNIEATGSGCAVVQSIMRYNTNTPPEKRNFNIEAVGKCNDDACKTASISISFSYIPEGQKAGMTLIEVKMITGVVPKKESLEELLQQKNLQIVRYEVENTKTVFYMPDVSNDDRTFTFQCEVVVQVDNPQPGTAYIYDYYNRDISSTTQYTLCQDSDSRTCPKEP